MKLKEQLGIYVRFVNLEEEKVAVHFLAYEDVKGSLSLSHWYPGSGVVLDCIDS